MLDERQQHAYDAMLAAKRSLVATKETVRWIMDSTVATPIMAALQQQIDVLNGAIEKQRLVLVAQSQA